MESSNISNISSTFNSQQPLFSICISFWELKSQDLVTPVSLKASLGALITTGIVCPFSLALNFLVLLAFYKKPSLRTQSNTMIGVMAANDLIKAGIGGAFFMSKEIDYQMEKQTKCSDVIGLVLAASIVSDIIVAGMNFEKFLALRFPYWHHVHITRGRILVTTLVAVLVGFILTVIRVFSQAGRFPVLFLFATVTISTLIFAVSIWKVISKRNHQIHSQQANVTTLSCSERKAAKMATYIAVGLFFTSVIPLILLTTLVQNNGSKIIAEPLLQALPLTACLINPLIYAFMNQEIRKACKEVAKCRSSTIIVG